MKPLVVLAGPFPAVGVLGVDAENADLARSQHFADKGVHVDLIKLYGSMELAPLTGLARITCAAS